MKKLFFIFGILFFFPATSSAHPGGTAADGGHYCWTNCSYYGVQYGVRHFHTTPVSIPRAVGYDELHSMSKGSAGYKKVSNGYKLDDFLTCKDKYIKKDGKCEKPKATKLKASKESSSLGSSAKNERVRFVNTLKKKRFIELEDLTDAKWKKYKKEILQNTPESEIVKYAPEWFVKENQIN